MYIACCIYCILLFTPIKAVMVDFLFSFFFNLPEYFQDLTVWHCCLCQQRSREPFVYWLLKQFPVKFQCVFIHLWDVQESSIKICKWQWVQLTKLHPLEQPGGAQHWPVRVAGPGMGNQLICPKTAMQGPYRCTGDESNDCQFLCCRVEW